MHASGQISGICAHLCIEFAGATGPTGDQGNAGQPGLCIATQALRNWIPCHHSESTHQVDWVSLHVPYCMPAQPLTSKCCVAW